nr:hypothetical protein Iba_chr02aCG9340 [Ipomoea batatas]
MEGNGLENIVEELEPFGYGDGLGEGEERSGSGFDPLGSVDGSDAAFGESGPLGKESGVLAGDSGLVVEGSGSLLGDFGLFVEGYGSLLGDSGLFVE